MAATARIDGEWKMWQEFDTSWRSDFQQCMATKFAEVQAQVCSRTDIIENKFMDDAKSATVNTLAKVVGSCTARIASLAAQFGKLKEHCAPPLETTSICW